MIWGFLAMMLGRVGLGLVSFYQQHSLILGAIAMSYGAVTVYAHTNLRRVMGGIEEAILASSRALGEQPDARQVHQRFVQAWKTEQAGKRLFLPSARDFWFRSLEVADLPELLHIGTDYVRVALHHAIGWPPREAFHPVDYGVWEEYRHRLLIGIRIKLPDIERFKAHHRQQQQKRAEREAARRQRKK